MYELDIYKNISRYTEYNTKDGDFLSTSRDIKNEILEWTKSCNLTIEYTIHSSSILEDKPSDITIEKGNILDGERWSIFVSYSKIILNFESKEDLMLFKLTWG